MTDRRYKFGMIALWIATGFGLLAFKAPGCAGWAFLVAVLVLFFA